MTFLCNIELESFQKERSSFFTCLFHEIFNFHTFTTCNYVSWNWWILLKMQAHRNKGNAPSKRTMQRLLLWHLWIKTVFSLFEYLCKGNLEYIFFALEKQPKLSLCIYVIESLMKFEKFLDQMSSFGVLWKLKVLFCDFIHNLSQAPSKCLFKWIKVDKWDYFKNPSQEFKKSFCSGFLWIPRKTGR